jgi:hypothetical protein
MQIGDENVHRVRAVMDEVFGDNNFGSQISFVTTTSQTSKYLPPVTDILLWYARSREPMKYRSLLASKDYEAQQRQPLRYLRMSTSSGETEPICRERDCSFTITSHQDQAANLQRSRSSNLVELSPPPLADGKRVLTG